MTLLLQHIFDFVNEEEEFWAYGYEINNKTFKYFIILYGNMVYYSTCSVIFLITFSLSLTFYRFVEILQLYGKLIQRNFKALRCRKNVKVLTEFFSMMKVLCLLNQVLSCVSLLIVIYALEMLFTTMHLAVSLREQILRQIPFLVKVIFNLVTGMLMIVFYTHCAAMIPERIIEIKYIARDHINNRISNPLITQDVLFYLKSKLWTWKQMLFMYRHVVCSTSLEVLYWLPSELHWPMICWSSILSSASFLSGSELP